MYTRSRRTTHALKIDYILLERMSCMGRVLIALVILQSHVHDAQPTP